MAVKGWVYVMTNSAMPGLVKVGFSLKDPSIRAAELGGTGVPHPFKVEYEALVKNPRDIEQKTHRVLQTKGMHESKEWFRCPLLVAISALEHEIKLQSAMVFEEQHESHKNKDSVNEGAFNSFVFNKFRSNYSPPAEKTITEEAVDDLLKLRKISISRPTKAKMVDDLTSLGWSAEHDGFKWILSKLDKVTVAYTTDDLYKFWLKNLAG